MHVCRGINYLTLAFFVILIHVKCLASDILTSDIFIFIFIFIFTSDIFKYPQSFSHNITTK